MRLEDGITWNAEMLMKSSTAPVEDSDGSSHLSNQAESAGQSGRQQQQQHQQHLGHHHQVVTVGHRHQCQLRTYMAVILVGKLVGQMLR